MTGPYHAIASLYDVIPNHGIFRERVANSKSQVMERFSEYIPRETNQPLLCTYIEGQVFPKDDHVVLYTPRSPLPGSIVCHLGEIYHNKVRMTDRIAIEGIQT